MQARPSKFDAALIVPSTTLSPFYMQGNHSFIQIRNCNFWAYELEFFQDFLINLDMKPLMHLVEISIFSLNNVTVRPTKIMNRDNKNRTHFYKIKYLKNQSLQKHFF